MHCPNTAEIIAAGRPLLTARSSAAAYQEGAIFAALTHTTASELAYTPTVTPPVPRPPPSRTHIVIHFITTLQRLPSCSCTGQVHMRCAARPLSCKRQPCLQAWPMHTLASQQMHRAGAHPLRCATAAPFPAAASARPQGAAPQRLQWAAGWRLHAPHRSCPMPAPWWAARHQGKAHANHSAAPLGTPGTEQAANQRRCMIRVK